MLHNLHMQHLPEAYFDVARQLINNSQRIEGGVILPHEQVICSQLVAL